MFLILKSRKFEIVERDINKAQAIIKQIKQDYQEGYVTNYAYAMHDKDRYTQDELDQLRDDLKDKPEELKQYEKLKEGDLKKPHYHIGFYLKNAAEFGTVANHYSCKLNMVTTIKSHYFKDYLTYLTHGNRPEKYQYPTSVVKTSVSDFKSLIEDTKTSYFAKHVKDVKDTYLERIRNGEWKLNYISQLSFERAKNADDKWLTQMYATYETAVKQAYQVYVSSQEDFSHLDRKVFFVQGMGGNGKTNFVHDWLVKNHIPSSEKYEAGEADPLGHYLNEEVVIFDDYRPNTLKFTQLLNCTDTNFAHIIDARYYDKKLTAKYVFITSSMSFVDWVKWFRHYKYDEDINQFIRRISYLVDVQKENIDVFVNHFQPTPNKEIDKQLKSETGEFFDNCFEYWKTISNSAIKFSQEDRTAQLKKPEFKI